ncbi:MAG: undecaprenyldiphospho-muramoylpentapeptide beta-N-acetylglucosaminyltransferase [Candidatus Moraniibacteriota bacterium]|nr:MAG: undecaprenyldiphospho-muramoylpentapeptide beta-N-acetylglucosaminyltransferase [Candidatus Moranbacteria bacterium]
MKRIVIAGGGTGGHIYPSISVIDQLRKRSNEKLEIIYVGSGSELEKSLYEASDRSYTITAGKIRRYFSWRNFTDPFLTLIGWFQSLMYLLREMPDVVFAKGGYVSFPVAIAARMYRIPVVIHESDAIPGTSNRTLGKFAHRIGLGFLSAKEYFLEERVFFTGNIPRLGITEGNPERARKTFSLSESKPVILVLGGSQGSKAINMHIVDILAEILPYAQIIHQTGEGNMKEVEERAKKREGIKPGRDGYHPITFLHEEEMKDAFSVADLVISRAGATSIAEIAACRKVSILIPLASSANDHQRMNAFIVAKKRATLVLEEANLMEKMLAEKIKNILFDKELREEIQKNIAEFDVPDSAQKVADLILECATTSCATTPIKN